jgi:hypothetical protein
MDLNTLWFLFSACSSQDMPFWTASIWASEASTWWRGKTGSGASWDSGRFISTNDSGMASYNFFPTCDNSSTPTENEEYETGNHDWFAKVSGSEQCYKDTTSSTYNFSVVDTLYNTIDMPNGELSLETAYELLAGLYYGDAGLDASSLTGGTGRVWGAMIAILCVFIVYPAFEDCFRPVFVSMVLSGVLVSFHSDTAPFLRMGQVMPDLFFEVIRSMIDPDEICIDSILDLGFRGTSGQLANGDVYAIALQRDGKVVIAHTPGSIT